MSPELEIAMCSAALRMSRLSRLEVVAAEGEEVVVGEEAVEVAGMGAQQ